VEIRNTLKVNGFALGLRMECRGDETGKHTETLPYPHLFTSFHAVFPGQGTPRGERPTFLASRGRHPAKPLRFWPDPFPHGPSRSGRAFTLSTPPQSS
jgi:hypothetical protein